MSQDPFGSSPTFDVTAISPSKVIDADGFDLGAGLLLHLRGALDRLPAGGVLELRSRSLNVREDIAAWCRLTSNELLMSADAGDHARLFIAKRSAGAGEAPDWGLRLPLNEDGSTSMRDWLVGRRADLPERAPDYYGFVPRGAVAEPGMPSFPSSLNEKQQVWADNVPELYEQAAAQQWNASRDIAWSRLEPLPEALEWAVCQVMTFFAENEYAALYIPSKFLPRINPQYVEVVLFLSTVINDEARHIEAFTKRALANGGGLQVATSLTEWSLHSLLLQEDYFRSSFLLHVLGEGTFLELLEFIERNAPDPITAEVARRARVDEGRHVAYGIAHVREQLAQRPAGEDELVAAAEDRAALLQTTGSENRTLTEALAILAGGGSDSGQISRGLDAVRNLYASMSDYRVSRLRQIGLSPMAAEQISTAHTPNFM